MAKHLCSVVLMFLLSACFIPQTPLTLSNFYDDNAQTPRALTICHGYGCEYTSDISLSKQEWSKVTAPLQRKATTPEQERKQIAQAIALMEKITGTKAGTEVDDAIATAFEHGVYQQDCIDEAVNTSLYLSLLAKENLLKWHEVAKPAQRGRFLDGNWPHHTAVIKEIKSKDRYAVDSWFLKNGEEPFIIPFEAWLRGWLPEELARDK